MRMLICKDAEQNTLLSYRWLEETDNITYEIIPEVPEIEEKEGYIGKYALDENGELVIVYEEIPESEIDALTTRLSQIQEEVAMLAEYTMLAMDADNEGV